MTPLWEGQAGAAGKIIFLVYYSNRVVEHVFLHVSKTSYYFTSFLYVEVILSSQPYSFVPSIGPQVFTVFFFPVCFCYCLSLFLHPVPVGEQGFSKIDILDWPC